MNPCFIISNLLGKRGRENGKVPTTFAELESMTLTRYSGNPIITHVASTWKDRQVHYPIIIEDPFDSTKLIMFYGAGSITYGPYYYVGRATANKTNPYLWTEYSGNPIIDGGLDFGNGSVLGPSDVWWNAAETRFEMLLTTYSGNGTTPYWEGLYYSNNGFDWTYEGVALGATGDEITVGNTGIIRDGATWYLYYCYRTSTTILPGIRVASSTNQGATWTKHGNVLTKGATGAYDDQYIEGLQAFKLGNTYVLNYGCSKDASGTITYSGAYAASTNPLSGFVKSSINPFFSKSVSGWDSTQISTAVYCMATEPWLLFYQGTNSVGDYNMALWDMGIATLT